jgi:hypothetical protein
MTRLLTRLTLVAFSLSLFAQVPAPGNDPFSPLQFLLGTWSAKTAGGGTAQAVVLGTYTFAPDLGGHALQRTGTLDSCKGPKAFDCNHHDQLTVYVGPSGTLAALYLDNEGHAIQYAVTTPDARTAVFLSQGPAAAPRFRLMYHLEGSGSAAVMTGKFQAAAPGSEEFHSYLEWFGTKQ